MSKYDIANLRIVLGDHDLKDSSDAFSTSHKVKRVVRHRLFDIGTLYNDIAVLTLEDPAQMRKEVQPICLESSSHDYTNTHVNVAGWGATSSGSATSRSLRKVDVRVWDRNVCANSYGNSLSAGITDTMICAASPEEQKDSCNVRQKTSVNYAAYLYHLFHACLQGDSGGPLFYCDQTCVQLGVVSFGIGCAEPQYPGVYSSVSKFHRWVEKVARKY
jgi:secreted trypsin-like serine protease